MRIVKRLLFGLGLLLVASYVGLVVYAYWPTDIEELPARSLAGPDDRLHGSFVATEGRLPEGVGLLPSPGHTQGHHSLVVASPAGTVVIAGDAVMTRDFFSVEEGFHNSVAFEQASETIVRIKGLADLVVPGHDNVIVNRRGY